MKSYYKKLTVPFVLLAIFSLSTPLTAATEVEDSLETLPVCCEAFTHFQAVEMDFDSPDYDHLWSQLNQACDIDPSNEKEVFEIEAHCEAEAEEESLDDSEE